MHLRTDLDRSVRQRIPLLLLGFIFCAGIFGNAAVVLAQKVPEENTNSQPKKVYDLPSGGGKSADDEDDITELIPIFGSIIYADSLYLCIEHTEWMKGERTEVISSEFNNLISSLSKYARFGAIAFNDQLHSYQNLPVFALARHKAAVKTWETSRERKDGASLAQALERTLELAHRDHTKHRAVAFIIDDRYADGEAALDLSEILQQQYFGSIPIHIFFISGGDPDPQLQFSCQQISAFSGGRFRIIGIQPEPGQSPIPPPPETVCVPPPPGRVIPTIRCSCRRSSSAPRGCRAIWPHRLVTW